MNYKNREQYKHLMRVLAVAAIVLLECAFCVLGQILCEPPVAGAVLG